MGIIITRQADIEVNLTAGSDTVRSARNVTIRTPISTMNLFFSTEESRELAEELIGFNIEHFEEAMSEAEQRGRIEVVNQVYNIMRLPLELAIKELDRLNKEISSGNEFDPEGGDVVCVPIYISKEIATKLREHGDLVGFFKNSAFRRAGI